MECISILREVERDNKWLQRNFEKLREEHPNKFVAISGKKVTADGTNSSHLVEKVEKMGKTPANILIEFIPEKGL